MSVPVLERTSHWATVIFVPGWWLRQRGVEAWLADYNDIASEPLVRGDRFTRIKLVTETWIRDENNMPVFAVVGPADHSVQLVLVHNCDPTHPQLVCRDPYPGELEQLLAA